MLTNRGQNMKRSLLIGIYVVASVFTVALFGQGDTIAAATQDTIRKMSEPLILGDTLGSSEKEQYNKKVEVKFVEDFQPDPTKAVIYSAIFPGLGQIYNKKYWKLPIVYGGFMGVVYAVSWNGNMYNDYKNGYKDIMLDHYTMKRWHNLVGEDPSIIVDDYSKLSYWQDRLKRNRDVFRRNRDLAIIVGVGLYALCMIDAYVDAHLYNFTVSPDLSMTMAPVVWGPSSMTNYVTVGFQCNIVF